MGSAYILLLAALASVVAAQEVSPSRSIIVPAAAVGIDIALPTSVLLVSAIVLGLRSRRSRGLTIPTPAMFLTNGIDQPAHKVLQVQQLMGSAHLSPSESSACSTGATAWVLRALLGAHVAKIRQIIRNRRKLTLEQAAVEKDSVLGRQAACPIEDLMHVLKTSAAGLSTAEAAARLAQHGKNQLDRSRPPAWYRLVLTATLQPFNLLMVAVAILTICPPNNDWKTFTLVMVLLLIAIILRFVEELRSIVYLAALETRVVAQMEVHRDGIVQQVRVTDIVPGDLLELAAGQPVPCDIRLLSSIGLQIGAAALTGEVMPIEKCATPSTAKTSPLHHSNLCLAGSNITTGSGAGIALATGSKTYVASMAQALAASGRATASDRAVRRIVFLFICFIAVMVPIVIALNGWTTRDWHGAVTFGLAVAVGLTPQMLPMILTANLSRGAAQMRAHNMAIKRLEAVQGMGAMDVLCTDKTGTLTTDMVTLVKHMNPALETSIDVLILAYLNSIMQDCHPNLLDQGIIHAANQHGGLPTKYAGWTKLAEVPFDFSRRRLTVVAKDPTAGADAAPLLICKGAVEELLEVCTHVLEGDTVTHMDDPAKDALKQHAAAMGADGLRMLGLASKTIVKPLLEVDASDECDLVFMGFLAFLDPPKPEAAAALQGLHNRGIHIKVLTGDALPVARHVCRSLGLAEQHCVEGHQLAQADEEQFAAAVRTCTVFAKVAPHQKLRIVAELQAQGRIVGALGDGTNDALALKCADVGISVHSATDVAKDAADIVIREQDLRVLQRAVEIGRVVYGNTIKYIKFSSSSSFGNCFSILAAAAWLPFVPIAPIQVLLLNLLYNVSQMAIPWDHMDSGFLHTPKRWSAPLLGLYMVIVGPMSSIFDIATFCIMWYYFKLQNDGPDAAFFQTGWFLESLLTQTVIVHMLRTERIPFIQSTAAWPLVLSSLSAMLAGIIFCYIPGLNAGFLLVRPLPLLYAFMIALVAGYCVVVQLCKFFYIRTFGTWL